MQNNNQRLYEDIILIDDDLLSKLLNRAFRLICMYCAESDVIFGRFHDVIIYGTSLSDAR